MKDLAYYLALPYTITLTELDPDEGGWFARVAELPGCMSDGETPEEARKNIKEAMELWLEVRIDNGWPIPEPENPDDTTPASPAGAAGEGG